MTDVAIRVDGLGKRYRIGAPQPGSRSFREVLTDSALRPFRTARRLLHGEQARPAEPDSIWALKDVSFDVRRGEVVGIIGRNGAGKSTLLRVLSRITEPTEGEADIYGRVGTLLEVGTGFHPELTGRENVFLNGAILGMRREEIRRKFDEIVAFADTEKFLDTPVKHYSSGMYVRLAFAVAAHLEPDILIVDEVLAVGDAAFQKKCLGKMGDVARAGRTVLFVSHNMPAVSTLTETAILLDQGRATAIGKTDDVIRQYLSDRYRKVTVWEAPRLNDEPIQILRAEIQAEHTPFDVQYPLEIVIDYVIRQTISDGVVTVAIMNLDGIELLNTEDIDNDNNLLIQRTPGRYRARVIIPGGLFRSGTYLIRFHSGIIYRQICDMIDIMEIDLVDRGNPKVREHKQGYFCPLLDWSTERISE